MLIRRMSSTTKKSFAISLLAAGILVVSARHVASIEIVPASVPEIIAALGPDANGLTLSQEALPDLFTLTANRIDEDSKLFTIQQPYTSGRWKGGKAVIEYARDLSYTLVSVYDREGHRQRIYSVSTQFTEHVEHLKVQAKEPPPVAHEPAPPSAVAAAKEAEAHHSYGWDDARGAYVPVVASAAAEAVDAEEKKPAVRPSTTTAEAPAQSVAKAPPAQKHKRRHPREETTPAAAPAAKVQVDNVTWVERRPAGSKETPQESPVPNKQNHPAESVPAARKPAVLVSSAPAVALVKPPPVESKPPPSSRDQWVPAEVVKNPVVDQSVPSEDELLGLTPTASKQSVPKPPVQEPKKKAVPVKKPVPAPVVAEAEKVESAPAPPPASENLPKPAAMAVAPGPDTSEGDAWVPKKTPKPVVESVKPPQEPVQVAMIPKPAPVDNSVENILKIANEKGAKESHESDTWVPQKTQKPNLEVDIDREVQRIRAQENKQAAERKTARIKRDVNNPEEGVLPVSSFEKFSGSMYGRHREYERRFVPGKNKLAKVPDHDFYVDEIDRKKEIHNIYYYVHQKGRGPRLIAVERHEKVTFLGNYDIEKEDSGKISIYN